MLGKIYIDNGWSLCKFDGNDLYILKIRCEKPSIISNRVDLPNNLLIAICEDNCIYYFNIASSIEIKLFSEYYYCCYENINYFVLDGLYFDYSIRNINKVSFVGGTISAMLQLMENNETNNGYEIIYASKKLNITFNTSTVENSDSCKLEYGNLLLYSQNVYTKYSIDISFENTKDISFILDVISKIYDFIKFINCNNSPCIQKIEISTDTFILNYFDKSINYNCDKINSYNYLSNVKNHIGTALNFFLNNSLKFDFLSLLEKNSIDFESTNILSQAIESIVLDNDIECGKILNTKIEKYYELRKEINNTIINFEIANNCKIDNDDRNFILTAVKIPTFRQKVETLLNCYNYYVKNYNKYYYPLNENSIHNISKSISNQRNNIHGEKSHTPDSFIYEIQYVIFGLLIYISKKCGFADGEIFNLYNKIFLHRIQQKTHYN